MPDFVGGYIMSPKDLYPFALAFGADCDYILHPTLPTGEYMDPLCIKTPINQVHRERNPNSGLDRLRGILLKSGRAAIFFPSHVEMSTSKQFIVKETEKDKELLERWLEPFKEKCTEAEISTFRNSIKYASCKTPLLSNRPVIAQEDKIRCGEDKMREERHGEMNVERVQGRSKGEDGN
ncbi:hypothetical protein AX16_008271 [Volvariella volvacea WC 439]|nr:hypothetical protein AX16_008271 [Volvariella volvacea WC 439]